MKFVDMTDRPELDEVTCFGYRRLKITCDDELADEIVSLILKLCFDKSECKEICN